MSGFHKVLGAFCVTAVLAGCGGSSTDQGTDVADAAGATESAEALRVAAAAGTRYTLTVSGQAGGSSPARRATAPLAKSLQICTCLVSGNMSG